METKQTLLQALAVVLGLVAIISLMAEADSLGGQLLCLGIGALAIIGIVVARRLYRRISGGQDLWLDREMDA